MHVGPFAIVLHVLGFPVYFPPVPPFFFFLFIFPVWIIPIDLALNLLFFFFFLLPCLVC